MHLAVMSFFCSLYKRICPSGTNSIGLLKTFQSKIRAVCFPIGIYLFKVNDESTTAMYKICSKLTIKTSQGRHEHRPGVFIVNFEKISHCSGVFMVDFE